jgi:hypothetical protein
MAPSEHPALEAAARSLSQELSRAAGVPVPVHCAYYASLAELETLDPAAIVITSLLPELDHLAEPWSAMAARLHAAYQRITQNGVNLFITTILRHVPRGEQADRVRVRIARLNLFAAEISRATGCNVIDIDRVLADIGARALQTDYRLAGQHAAEAVAATVALTLLSLGLDEYATYEIQETARAAIAERSSAWKHQLAPAHEMIREDLISLGAGRRKQRISLVVNTVEEQHVSWLVRRVLMRQISLSDALVKLRRAIHKRGWRESSSTILAGVITLLRDRADATRSRP